MKTKSKCKNKLVSAICILLIAITTITAVAPIAASAASDVVTSAAGSQTIKALGANTQIGPKLSKETTVRYSSIWFDSQVSSYTVYFWVYDYTRSSTLSDKRKFTVTSEQQKKWLPYKNDATYNLNDALIIYGEQYTASSKGINYITYGGKSLEGSL